MNPVSLALPVLLLTGAAGSMLLPGATASVELAAPGTAAGAPTAFQVDGRHSFAMFRVEHLGIGIAYGQFRKLSGSFQFDAEDVTKSSVELVIDATSVDSNNADRDKHLRGSDFLSVKEFPEIRFQSTAVKSVAEGALEIVGKMTLHGTELEVTAVAHKIGEGTDPWGGYRSGFEATFKIDRIAFGVDYMPDGLGKEVSIVVAIEGVRQDG